MHDQEALDRLAVLCGIAPEYIDIWGQTHLVSGATKQVLLAAMGVAVADTAQLHSSLAEHESAPWRRPLPPVWVHRLGPEPLQIPLTLPVSLESMPQRWLVQTEDGSQHQGELHAAALPALNEREIDGERYQ
ncbi:MAG TPA: hypothetical protein VFL97_05475, partial [Nitrococcus sp.]|nr:hypothetical protein [Nitrococcus sp.]